MDRSRSLTAVVLLRAYRRHLVPLEAKILIQVLNLEIIGLERARVGVLFVGVKAAKLETTGALTSFRQEIISPHLPEVDRPSPVLPQPK